MKKVLNSVDYQGKITIIINEFHDMTTASETTGFALTEPARAVRTGLR